MQVDILTLALLFASSIVGLVLLLIAEWDMWDTNIKSGIAVVTAAIIMVTGIYIYEINKTLKGLVIEHHLHDLHISDRHKYYIDEFKIEQFKEKEGIK